MVNTFRFIFLRFLAAARAATSLDVFSSILTLYISFLISFFFSQNKNIKTIYSISGLTAGDTIDGDLVSDADVVEALVETEADDAAVFGDANASELDKLPLCGV